MRQPGGQALEELGGAAEVIEEEVREVATEPVTHDHAQPQHLGQVVRQRVRRHLLLRSLIERKARHLKDSHGPVRIDPGLLRALLRVPTYKHGARSMEAIVDMHILVGQSCWEPDALPPADQLALHVDPHVFLRMVSRDVLLSAAREVLRRVIHERYRTDQKDR